MIVEKAQQAIMQHFDLARRGVTDVDLDGVVRATWLYARGVRRFFVRLDCRPPRKDVSLHCPEACLGGIAIGFAARHCRKLFREKPLHVARQTAPGGDQFVSLGVVAASIGVRPIARPEIARRAQQKQMDVHDRADVAQQV